MPQVSAMSSGPMSAGPMSPGPMVATVRAPRTTVRRAQDPAPARRLPEDEKMGVGAYLLQGSAFIGFLLVLFVLAGFRG